MSAETITVDEVTALLKALAARDQRTTDTADTLAWYQDLNNAQVTYRDASAAASHYYANVWPRQDPRQRFRATAPVLIELVLSLRKQRLADANFVYQPAGPDETGAQFTQRLRQQISAVANGHVPAQPIGQALKARPVAELVASVANARALPPEITQALKRRRNPARSITCPHCKAQAGSTCRNGEGRELGQRLHPGRIDAWATAVAACPECHMAPGDACREMGQPYPHGAHRSRVSAAQNDPEEAS